MFTSFSLFILLHFLFVTINCALSITCGYYHTCALKHNAIKCFGDNYYGELGLGNTLNRGDDPNEMGSNLSIVDLGLDFIPTEVVAGAYHNCALSTANKVKCWGYNDNGELGYGDTVNRGNNTNDMGINLQEVDLGAGFTTKQIYTGYPHSCALSTANKVKCWGYNDDGQLGNGDTMNRGDSPNQMGDNLKKVDLGSGFIPTQIALGAYHSCAFSNDTVKCWGSNTFGKLGYEDINARGDEPNEMGDSLSGINLGLGFIPMQISAGIFHTCALSTNNIVKCWGYNADGQLGYGDIVDRGGTINDMGQNLLPVDLGTNFIAKQIIAGAYHTCALSTMNKVKCWGYNGYGQLGYGDTDDRGDAGNEMSDNLLEIDLGSSFIPVQIIAGAYHNCAVSASDDVKCWGWNDFGQLGYGDTTNRGDTSNEMGDNLFDVDLGVFPSQSPTAVPSQVTLHPSLSPSEVPTNTPTLAPSEPPTNIPSFLPTKSPTVIPPQVTLDPSLSPSEPPTNIPSQVTSDSSLAPSQSPTVAPSSPSYSPTQTPYQVTSSLPPSKPPTYSLTGTPIQYTSVPTDDPSTSPSPGPSLSATESPTYPSSSEVVYIIVIILVSCCIIILCIRKMIKVNKQKDNENMIAADLTLQPGTSLTTDVNVKKKENDVDVTDNTIELQEAHTDVKQHHRGDSELLYIVHRTKGFTDGNDSYDVGDKNIGITNQYDDEGVANKDICVKLTHEGVQERTKKRFEVHTPQLNDTTTDGYGVTPKDDV